MTYTVPTLLNVPMNIRGGGLGLSAVRRANLLAEYGHHPVLLVNVMQANFELQVEAFRSSGKLDRRVEVRSMLADLRRAGSGNEAGGKRHYPGIRREKYRVVDNPKAPHLSSYYLGEERVAVENRGSVSGLFMISFFENGKRRRTYNCFPDYSVVSVDLRDDRDVVYRTDYVDSEGYVFLSHDKESGWVHSASDGGELRFADEDAITLHWLKEYCDDILESGFAITEWAYRDKLIRELNKSLGAAFLVQFHSNHLSNSYARRYGPTQGRLVKTVKLVSDEVQGEIITLTPQQRFDLLKAFPSFDSVTNIPHYVGSKAADSGITRDPNKIVTVSRLADGKNLHHVIPVFSRVLERAKEAHWEIYGSGEMEPEYRRLISEYGLEDRIVLKGYTSNSASVYASAAVSLYPSFFEGQALSLMESVAEGCVPVAFDFKYGARYCIEDGRTGFIVDMDNYAEMADSAGLLVARPELREAMAVEGKEHLLRVNDPERIVRLWESCFERYCTQSGRLSNREVVDDEPTPSVIP